MTPVLTANSAALSSAVDTPRTSTGKRNWSVVARYGANPPPRGPQDVAASPGGFADALKVLNPIHQVPILGKTMGAAQGPSVAVPARILGGLLLGGPVGFLLAVGSTILAQGGSD